jgi:hypothetical protein
VSDNCVMCGSPIPGAAKNLAYRAIRDGWQKMVLSAKEQGLDDRIIQVSKGWPSL